MKIKREIRVGVMVVVAIFLFYFGINYLKGISIFQSGNQYIGKFDHIDGLVKSAPVKIKGYKVGQVNDIQYDFSKDEPFEVRIEVHKGIDLPYGTVMLLTDDGLLGGKIIELVGLEKQTNPKKSYAKNDILPTEINRGIMDDLTGGLIPKIETIANQTDSMLMAVRMLLTNPALEASLISIERTSSELSLASTELKGIMRGQLPALLEGVNDVTTDLKITTDNFSKIDFASTVDRADRTIKNLEEISGKINGDDGSLGLLMNDKDLYLKLSNTVESADRLLIDLKEHPKRYINLSVFGGKEK